MGKHCLSLAVFIACYFLSPGLSGTWVSAQDSPPPVAWEMTFSKDIHWCEKTSAGVLLVRSGNMLYGIDGEAGTELWSLKGLDLGSKKPGKVHNLLEVPGTPLLLAKKKGRNPPTGPLLTFDLWDGHDYRVRQSAQRLLAVVPLYGEDKLLLVHGGFPPFSPRMKLKPFTQSRTIWDGKFPVTIQRQNALDGGFRTVAVHATEMGLYGHFFTERGSFVLARIDSATGDTMWQTRKFYANWTPPWAEPLFLGDQILLGGKDIYAFDPNTGKRLWTVEHMGPIYDWELDREKNALFVVSEKGFWTIDLTSGALTDRKESKQKIKSAEILGPVVYTVQGKSAVVLDVPSGEIVWELETRSEPEQIEYRSEAGTLLILDKRDILEVDLETGEVIRRISAGLEADPVEMILVGQDHLLLHFHKLNWRRSILVGGPLGYWGEFDLRVSLVELSTGEVDGAQVVRGGLVERETSLTSSGDSKVRFRSAVPFRQVLAEVGSPLEAEIADKPTWKAISERFQRLAPDEGESYVVLEDKEKKGFRVLRFHASEPKPARWFVPGAEIAVYPGFFTAYTFQGKTLRAYKLQRQ